MKNKVFVVTTGEYSDYNIDQIFTSLDKAEQYVAANSTYLDEYRVETYNVDDVEVNVTKDEMGYCYYEGCRLIEMPMLKSRFIKIKDEAEKKYEYCHKTYSFFNSPIGAKYKKYFEGVWLPQKDKVKAQKILTDIQNLNKAVEQGIT